MSYVNTVIAIDIKQTTTASNILLGIDLRAFSGSVGLPPSVGPTPNDTGDLDSGSGNNLQNYPTFNSAQVSGATLTVNLNVDSSSVIGTSSLRVELFEGDTDLTNPEGARFLAAQCFAGNNLANVTGRMKM